MTTTQEPEVRATRTIRVQLDEVHDLPDNPRSAIKKDEGFKELVASIKALGILQPPTVFPRDEGGYTLVMGHRRTAAARDAGLTEIDVNLNEHMTASQAVETALVENLMRQDLNPVEEARGYFRLVALSNELDGKPRTVASIAKATGRGTKYVTERLALMELPKDVLKHVETGSIALGQVKFLRDALDAEVPAEKFKELVQRAREGHSIESNTATAIAGVRRDAALEEIRAKCEAKGIEVVFHRGSVYDLPKKVAALDEKLTGASYEYLIPKFTAPHKGEPCEGVLVVFSTHGTEAPKSGKACLDLSRHRKSGDSDVKIVVEEDPHRQAQAERDKAERAERAADKERKIGLLTGIEAAVKPSTNATAKELVAWALIGHLNADSKRLLCQGLGLEPDRVENVYGERNAKNEIKMENDWHAPIIRYAQANATSLQRAAVIAAAVSAGEFYIYPVGFGSYSQHSPERYAQAALNTLSDELLGETYDATWVKREQDRAEAEAKRAAKEAEAPAEPEAQVPDDVQPTPDAPITDGGAWLCTECDTRGVGGEDVLDHHIATEHLGMDEEDAEAVRAHLEEDGGDNEADGEPNAE